MPADPVVSVSGTERGHDTRPGQRQPPRGELPPEVVKAARLIHGKVWNGPYKQLEGPMHHAGGPYWRGELLRLADEWERMAVAARICAEVLPDVSR